jgi:predicted MFS family arabinose efflux permease
MVTEVSQAVNSGATEREIKVKGRWLALTILCAIYALCLVDRQVLAVLIEPIRKDIALSDTQVGLLTGTFFGVVYSLFSLPAALIADRAHRVRLVAGACMVWSAFTAFTGLASSFAALAVGRIGVAVGESGSYAPSMSLISDYFPPRQRVLAITAYVASATVGIFLGTLLGGVLAASYGWRAALIVPGAIGIAVGLILLVLVREPERGTNDDLAVGEAGPAPLSQTIMLYVRLRSLSWLLVSGALVAIIGNSILAWTPALLMRSFGADVHQVAVYWSLVVGGGLIAGALASGALLTWLLRFTSRAYTLLPAIGMTACAPLLAFSFSSASWSSFLLSVIVPIALVNMVVAPSMALTQELAPARQRATAAALLTTVMNLVGIGVGPVLVGSVSEWLKSTAGQESLRHAMLITLTPLCLACALCLYMASRHLRDDLARR